MLRPSWVHVVLSLFCNRLEGRHISEDLGCWLVNYVLLYYAVFSYQMHAQWWPFTRLTRSYCIINWLHQLVPTRKYQKSRKLAIFTSLTIPVPQEDRMDLFTNPEHRSFFSNSLLDKNVTSGGSIDGFHSRSFRPSCFGNVAHFFNSWW